MVINTAIDRGLLGFLWLGPLRVKPRLCEWGNTLFHTVLLWLWRFSLVIPCVRAQLLVPQRALRRPLVVAGLGLGRWPPSGSSPLPSPVISEGGGRRMGLTGMYGACRLHWFQGWMPRGSSVVTVGGVYVSICRAGDGCGVDRPNACGEPAQEVPLP